LPPLAIPRTTHRGRAASATFDIPNHLALCHHAMMLSAILSQTSNTGLSAGLGVVMILVIVIGIAATLFWLWMLIDCLTSDMPSGDKILWFLVIFFLHLLGAVI